MSSNDILCKIKFIWQLVFKQTKHFFVWGPIFGLEIDAINSKYGSEVTVIEFMIRIMS